MNEKVFSQFYIFSVKTGEIETQRLSYELYLSVWMWRSPTFFLLRNFLIKVLPLAGIKIVLIPDFADAVEWNSIQSHSFVSHKHWWIWKIWFILSSVIILENIYNEDWGLDKHWEGYSTASTFTS